MPKYFARGLPVGIVLALVLVAGVWLSWSGPQPSRGAGPLSAISALFAGWVTGAATADEYDAERRELEFLAAALHRIEAELLQEASRLGAPSLRTEEEAVTERLRQVASRVPADSLPPDIRRLIEPETTPVPAATPVPAPVAAARSAGEAAAVHQASALRVGLRPPSPVADFSSLALDARPPWPLFTKRRQPRETTPAAPAGAADRPETRAPSR